MMLEVLFATKANKEKHQGSTFMEKVTKMNEQEKEIKKDMYIMENVLESIQSYF